MLARLGPRRAPASTLDDYAARPSVTLGGVFRDFEPAGTPGGHPDFGLPAADGAGRYVGIAADELGPDDAPVLARTGRKVVTAAMNGSGVPIPSGLAYVSALPGDLPGSVSATAGGAVTSAGSFAQWFSDVPGVNESEPGGVTLVRNASNDGYVFEGTLDGPGELGADGGAGTNSAYTYAIDTTFVHESGKDWFIDVDTSADVWVYIDGKLVIDSGSGAGLVGLQDFEIVDGQVVPGQPFAAAVTVLGVAFSSGGVLLPVAAEFRAGTEVFSPFGALTDPSGGNLNDDENPRRFVLPDVYPAGTPLSVTGRSFMPDGGSKWKAHMTVDSRTPGSVVLLLRDGDDVPDIKPFEDQEAAAAFLKDYIEDGQIRLASNQAIYLFEMYTTNLSDPTADFQDLVVLVELAHRTEDLASPGGGGGGAELTEAAPSVRQRIDLDRLPFLRDGATHTIQIFLADRNPTASPFRLETNITTLNLAATPTQNWFD
jgi:fibro-slime domain-containing protein